MLASRTVSNIQKVIDFQQRADPLEKEYRQWYSPIPSSWASMVVARVDEEDADLAASFIQAE
jgi:hypothetical protein